MMDHQFNIFLVEIYETERTKLKYFLGAKVLAPKPVNQSPKQPEYGTGISVLHIIFHNLF